MSPRGTALSLAPAGVKSVPVGVLANLPGNTMGARETAEAQGCSIYIGTEVTS